MAVIIFPFRYYSVLPDYTLTTKIREESWNLAKLFPLVKQTKSEIKRLRKSIKTNISDLLKLRHAIVLLSAEIRTGFKDLKLINFYDSAILYLHYRLLKHVFNLCKNEEKKLLEEKEKALSQEIKLKDKKLEDIKKAKEEIEQKIKEYEKIIQGLGIAEKELIKADAHLINRLRKLRWKAEKRAQHEFSFEELTLRSMENLNRKIKVEAINVKKVIPYKMFLMKKIQKQRQINTEDVISLAKLILESIDRVSKDVAYSSKLIKQLEDEMGKLKRIVEKLKKPINKLVKKKKIKEETAQKLIKPWDDAINYVEKEVDKDLMKVFRNIFVEYKYVATRPLAA